MDELKHYGVLGMKWGVRKDRGKKSWIQKRNEKYDNRMRKITDKYHEKHKNKRVYSRQYNRNLKLARGNHHKAVARTRKEMIEAKQAIALSVTSLVAPVAVREGSKLVRKAHNTVTDPVNIRKGKNVVQAMKRSPVRYVDGSEYKDVIDMR